MFSGNYGNVTGCLSISANATKYVKVCRTIHVLQFNTYYIYYDVNTPLSLPTLLALLPQSLTTFQFKSQCISLMV